MRFELAIGARPQVAELERAEAGALQAPDRMPDVLAHSLDLVLASFVDGELERVGGDPSHARRRGAAVVERHPGAECLHRLLANGRVGKDRAIGLLDFEARMGEPVGELTVIGQEDQAGRVDVEAAHRVQPQGRENQRHHRRAALGIASGGDHSEWLVDGEDDARGRLRDGPAIHFDLVGELDCPGRVGDLNTADRHPPGANQPLGFAARGEAGRRQILGQAHLPGTIEAVDLSLIKDKLDELEQPAYRSEQVWRWAAQGAGDYRSMTNLPLQLRDRLADAVPFTTLTLEREAASRDGTVKALFSTHDGRPVEAVLMRYRDGRRSLCLSSQSGCPLTCTFCATGQMRFGRNLSTWEILDQALHFRRVEHVDHAVFMGMGEPLMNLDHVLGACRLLPDLGITHRRTAISTVGWIPGIVRLAGDPMPLRLALSLHAADETLRSELMPVNDRYPLPDVISACESYYARKRRKVFIEYVMLAGVNDSHAQAAQLAGVLDPRVFKVNLIPYNPTASPYRGSSGKAIEAFKAELERHGLDATIRLTRGRDIDAACGQLAARNASRQAGGPG